MKRSAFELAASEHAESRKSKGTRALYRTDLGRWLSWCEEHDVDPSQAALVDASVFKDWLEDEKKLAALTVRRVLAALSAMYDNALARDVPAAKRNPFKKLPRPSPDSYAQTKDLSPELAERVIATAEKDTSAIGMRDAAVLWLLYETGVRRETLVLMERAKIYDENGRTVASVIVKGQKRREVVLSENAQRALKRWLATDSGKYVFPASRNGGHLRPQTVNKIVKRRAREAGLEDEHIHPHRFRAAFATQALDAGVPLHEVQAAMHHSNPATTLRYDRGKRGGDVTNALAEYRKAQRPELKLPSVFCIGFDTKEECAKRGFCARRPACDE